MIVGLQQRLSRWLGWDEETIKDIVGDWLRVLNWKQGLCIVIVSATVTDFWRYCWHSKPIIPIGQYRNISFVMFIQHDESNQCITVTVNLGIECGGCLVCKELRWKVYPFRIEHRHCWCKAARSHWGCSESTRFEKCSPPQRCMSILSCGLQSLESHKPQYLLSIIPYPPLSIAQIVLVFKHQYGLSRSQDSEPMGRTHCASYAGCCSWLCNICLCSATMR